MTTQNTRTSALAAAAAVVACLVLAGCGTETAAPGQDIGNVVQNRDKAPQTDPPGTHKLPPDAMP